MAKQGLAALIYSEMQQAQRDYENLVEKGGLLERDLDRTTRRIQLLKELIELDSSGNVAADNNE